MLMVKLLDDQQFGLLPGSGPIRLEEYDRQWSNYKLMDKPKQRTGEQSGRPGAAQQEVARSTRSPENIGSGQDANVDSGHEQIFLI